MTHQIDESRRDDRSPAHVPGVCVTRRSLMNKIVAIATTVAAVPFATSSISNAHQELSVATALDPAPHPDADLLARAEQFVVADRKYREAAARVDRMDDERRSTVSGSPLPEVLRWRQSDFDLGLPPLLKGTAYGPNWEHSFNVDQLRREKWNSSVTTIFKPGENELVYHWTTPTEAARARADEIIRAYDEWHKGEAAPAPRGYKTAEKARDKACKTATKLENVVLHMRATTIDGMLAKIRCAQSQALFYGGKLPPVDELQELEMIAGSAQYIAESLFWDIWRLSLSRVHDRSFLAVDVVATLPGEPSRDPIFAKIEAHRKAWAACKVGDAASVSEQKSNALCEKEWKAMDRIAKTVPITLSGLLAMLSYIGVAIEQQGDAHLVFGDDATAVFTSMAEAAKALSAAQYLKSLSVGP
jgi:hypothetical protein